MFSMIMMALFVTHCATVDVPFCPIASSFEAHNVYRWHATGTPWMCDGTVWFEARLDQEPPVEVLCMMTPTLSGDDTLVYCPDFIAPVKHWDRAPGQSAWLQVVACNAVGCSDGCTVELIWPAYMVYS